MMLTSLVCNQEVPYDRTQTRRPGRAPLPLVLGTALPQMGHPTHTVEAGSPWPRSASSVARAGRSASCSTARSGWPTTAGRGAGSLCPRSGPPR
jgi:hypothetical protein